MFLAEFAQTDAFYSQELEKYNYDPVILGMFSTTVLHRATLITERYI